MVEMAEESLCAPNSTDPCRSLLTKRGRERFLVFPMGLFLKSMAFLKH